MIKTTTTATTFAIAITADGFRLVATVGGCLHAWLGWRHCLRGSVRQCLAQVRLDHLVPPFVLGHASPLPVMAISKACGGSKNMSRYSAVA